MKNNAKYLREYIELCSKEWGTQCNEDEFQTKINKKLEEILLNKNKKIIVALGLINDNILVGFVSLLSEDGHERPDLVPWYGTMYVKEEFRSNGYSKVLNNAILTEAKRLGYKKVYLKTTLTNYYEKFGAKCLDKLNDYESLYYIEII